MVCLSSLKSECIDFVGIRCLLHFLKVTFWICVTDRGQQRPERPCDHAQDHQVIFSRLLWFQSSASIPQICQRRKGCVCRCVSCCSEYSRGEVPTKTRKIKCVLLPTLNGRTLRFHINTVAVWYSSGLHHVDLALKCSMWELKPCFLYS